LKVWEVTHLLVPGVYLKCMDRLDRQYREGDLLLEYHYRYR